MGIRAVISEDALSQNEKDALRVFEAVAKLQFRRQAGTDRGPFQSRPKVPIQKLSPSRSSKKGDTCSPFFEHLQSKCYFMRAAARNAEKNADYMTFRQTEDALRVLFAVRLLFTHSAIVCLTLLYLQRLCQMGIHACGEALLCILVKGVCGHGDDGQRFRVRSVERANGFVASMPFITGIITSMRTASNVSGGLFCTISTACLPSVTTVTVAPSSVSRICAISALSALSSTSSSLQPAMLISGAAVRPVSARETVQFQTAG